MRQKGEDQLMVFSATYKWHLLLPSGKVSCGAQETINRRSRREVVEAIVGKRLVFGQVNPMLFTDIKITPIGRLKVE